MNIFIFFLLFKLYDHQMQSPPSPSPPPPLPPSSPSSVIRDKNSLNYRLIFTASEVSSFVIPLVL